MCDTILETIAKINENGLPTIFERILNQSGPKALECLYTRPIRFFKVRKSLEPVYPRIASIIPLLEWNRERILAFDEASKLYIDYYYGDASSLVIGKHYQQFLAWIFVDLGCAGLIEVVHNVASDFHFQHLDLLIRYLESDDELSATDSKWRFIETITS